MASLYEFSSFEDFFQTSFNPDDLTNNNHNNNYNFYLDDSFLNNSNNESLNKLNNNYNYYSSPEDDGAETTYSPDNSLASPYSAPATTFSPSPYDILSPPNPAAMLSPDFIPAAANQFHIPIKVEDQADEIYSPITNTNSTADENTTTEKIINRELQKQKLQHESEQQQPPPQSPPEKKSITPKYPIPSTSSSSTSSVPTPPSNGLDYNGRKPRKWRNRKYKCSHCGKYFLDQDLHLYAQHIEEIEKQKNGISISKRKYKCAHPSCPWHKIGFVRKLEAQKHYVRKHGVPQLECRFWSPNGEKYPGCGICTTRWHADSGNRSRHEHAIHGNGLRYLQAEQDYS